ncbi:MAG: MFS transporter, partial [Acidimicrobiaceae bacterium]|nr:MFS transporter [Acidimicrobiaceae bacterium]
MPHREPATLRPATLPVILATTLLVTVNAAIVNVALTSIRHDLGFTANTISWVINAYLLAYGGLLIVGGRLGDVIGRRRAMLIGLALFTAAALVGGFAGSPAVLVAARGVQGVGGALAAPAVLAMITDLYQDSARAKALSWFSVVLGVGLSFGFIAGGVILQWLDWRWVFWINVPVGIALFPLTLLFVPALRASQKHRLDVAGAVLATLTAVGVVLAVVQLANLHRPDAVFALSVAVAAVALIGLVLRLRTASEPLIPLGMFLRRSTVGALVAMTLQSGAATALLFFLSQLFAGGLGLVPIGV